MRNIADRDVLRLLENQNIREIAKDFRTTMQNVKDILIRQIILENGVTEDNIQCSGAWMNSAERSYFKFNR